MKYKNPSMIKVKCKYLCILVNEHDEINKSFNSEEEEFECGKKFRPTDIDKIQVSCVNRITHVDWITLLKFGKHLEVIDG